MKRFANTIPGNMCVLLRPPYQPKPVKQAIVRDANPICVLLRRRRNKNVLSQLYTHLFG